MGEGLRSFARALACASAILGTLGCDDDEPVVAAPEVVDSQTPIEGSSIPQFAQPLPLLSVAGGPIDVLTGNQPLTIRMCEVWANVLPPGTFGPGERPKTRVWAYIEGECPPNGPDDPAVDTYTGPLIISERSNPPARPRPPTTVTWINDLGTTETTRVTAYRRSVDQTLHWADPNELHCAHGSHETIPAPDSRCSQPYSGPIPAVVHLHGGEVPPVLDGGPDAWFLSEPAPGYRMHGASYYSLTDSRDDAAVYAYPNTQEAASLWFHDHTLGTTTLNVYAGLAGVYLIVDPELDLPEGLTATGLAGPDERAIIPLVIQDRAFDTEGQLFYPADANGGTQWSPNPQHPRWTPEAFLDTIVVNGKAWPFLEVEPRRYRFVLVEGSVSRAFALSIVDATGNAGPPIWVIGTEEGYLDAPIEVDAATGSPLVMLPGERYDVIVDFGGLAEGTQLVLQNTAPTPYPSGDAPDPATTGRVLQFRVVPCASGACGAADASYDPASGAPILTGRDRLVRFADPSTGQLAPSAPIAQTRALTLNEITLPASTAISPITGQETEYPGGPVVLLLNNSLWSGDSARPYDDQVTVTLGGATLAVSEVAREGTAEVWEIVNLTMDAHPIHTHLTDLQILNRQPFDMEAYMAAYGAAFPDGEVMAGFGPPLDYDTGNPRALGGNPDVTPFLIGSEVPPQPYESGWKDTFIAPPGYVTRVIVRFAPSSLPLDAPDSELAFPFDPSGRLGYPWHCHITTHEDNEMMRAFLVEPSPAAPIADRPLQLGRDY